MLHSVCYFVIYSVNSIYEDKQIGGISPHTKQVFLKTIEMKKKSY